MQTTRDLAAAAGVTLLWPAAAAVSLSLGARGEAVSTIGLEILALGTAGAYALDRLRDGGDLHRVRALLCTAVALCGLGSLMLIERQPWRALIIAMLTLLAVTYVPLKRVIPKNVIATLAWTHAVMVLPAAVAPNWDGEYLRPALAVACIMFANTTLCDLGTVEEDRGRGVKSISVCYGVRAARGVAFVVAVAGAAVWPSHPELAVAAIGHAILAAWLPRQVRLWADGILLVPGFLMLIR